jgi:hypothetical protein
LAYLRRRFRCICYIVYIVCFHLLYLLYLLLPVVVTGLLVSRRGAAQTFA